VRATTRDAASPRPRHVDRLSNPRGACALTCLLAVLSNAGAAPFGPSPEDRYISTRDAVIEKFAHDAGKFDDTTKKAEEEARAGLQAQMSAILGELKRSGFGPATLNLDSLYKGHQDCAMLDGLRLDAEVGTSGEKAGQNGADGKYVWPRAHIIVTTQTIFERWLAHKDWWGKDIKNVPQQIGLALKDESFYTQAISTDAAVVSLPPLLLPTGFWPPEPKMKSLMLRIRCSFPRSPTARFISPMPKFAPAIR